MKSRARKKSSRAAADAVDIGSVVTDRALPMREFPRSLPMALLRAREAVMCRFRPALRKRGVTEQQWRILRALAHSAPIEVTALADATFLLPPSLSRILVDLESRGLIARRQHEVDRRRAIVTLRPAGLKLIAAHAPDSEAIYAEIARAFGAEQLERLLALLKELERALGQEKRGAAPPAATRARKRAHRRRRA